MPCKHVIGVYIEKIGAFNARSIELIYRGDVFKEPKGSEDVMSFPHCPNCGEKI